MSVEKVLAQQETAISDARIAQLSECRYLSEQEVIELAAKCKVCKQAWSTHKSKHACKQHLGLKKCRYSTNDPCCQAGSKSGSQLSPSAYSMQTQKPVGTKNDQCAATRTQWYYQDADMQQAFSASCSAAPCKHLC
jgi:hypothetical protein